MPSVLDSLPPDSRVAVIRLRSLGDCVLTTPALQLLKDYRPDLRIAVVVEDRFREIFEGHPAVTQVLAPPVGDVRAFRPSLCLNFHGGTRSATLTALSGARVRAGFTHYRSRFVYNRIIPRAQEILRVDRKVHTAEHLASAMFFLGVPQAEIPRASLFAPRDKAGQRPALLKGIPTEIGVERGSMRHPVETRNDGPPACRVERSSTCIFHAVAATPEKTWPAARFLEVARHLDQSGIEPIFIGAPADDLTPFAAYRTIQGASLSEVMTLLASASLFVGNDSGPAHMAAAFGLPTVVLFGPSDPEIWGPWRTAGEVLRDPAGLAAVPASRVIEALDRLRVHA